MYGPLIGLVPTILLIQNSTNFDDVNSMYRSDLPTPKLFDNELLQWRMHFSFKDGCLPNSIVSALKECDPSLPQTSISRTLITNWLGI